MTSSRILRRIQALALIWLVVLVWLSQSSQARFNDPSEKDKSEDASDEKENMILKAIRPLETDLKPVLIF